MQQNIQNKIAGEKGTDQAMRQGQFDSEANLVVQRDGRVAQGLEHGEVSSLAQTKVFDPKFMGQNAIREKPPQLTQKDDKVKKDQQKKKKKDKQLKVLDAKKNKRVRFDKNKDILNVDIDSNIIYKPKTKENKQLYEQIVTIISRKLSDISSEELKSYTDEILAIFFQKNKTDNEKYQEMQNIILCEEQDFEKIYQLSRKITDYSVDTKNKLEPSINQMQVEENLILNDSDQEDNGSQDEQNDFVEDDEDKSESDDGMDQSDDQVMIAARGDIEIEEEEDDQKYYLDMVEVDRFWLQTQLNNCFDDAVQAKELEPKILSILKKEDMDCQKQLIEILKYEHFELIQLLTKNRLKIYYKIMLAQAQNKVDKDSIIQEMEQTEEGKQTLQILEAKNPLQQKELILTQKRQKEMKKEALGLKNQKKEEEEQAKINRILMSQDLVDEEFSKLKKEYLDLDSIKFPEGVRLMSNQKCTLPPESFRVQKKGYDEIYIQAVKHKVENQKQVNITDMPKWTHKAFQNIQKLNYIQSQVYQKALFSSDNMLVCAPTGAGKTNVAVLTMLQEIGKWLKSDGKIDVNKFKIVYISPMKALVAEQVGNFGKRLEPYGIKVRELTGDMQLSKQQIEDTQVIISTPEKWDIVTRKAGDRTYTELVKLIIIDEIHLLHDSRGPVLESLGARTIRSIEQTQSMIRIVGLSATLPNYADVASFIRVKKEGLFYFDSTYRPVPLEQQYIGISEKKAVRRLMLMNEILYDKVIERAGKYQMIIFAHSRRETAKTAQYLKEMAYSKDQLSKFVKPDSDTKKVLDHVSENINNPELKELLPYGFAIHHAGLSRGDRGDIEDLFAGRHIQVLVSTATLAWGVNLPAHTVIIKGTQIYSPEEGKWKELSPQDILQMMGRAGRPGYDSQGEGIILTAYSEMKFYLSVLNQQLPIESQMINLLPDQLNAEIVLGSINNIKDAVNWLGYTYLYIRMLRNPQLYGITEEEFNNDKLLVQRRTNLIHSAAQLLHKNGLINYDRPTGEFQVKYLGKIASHYYIKYPSIETYNKNLKPNITMIELFRIFSLSNEFQFIPIRDEEKGEILKLMDSVPIPIKGSSEDPTTKVNILLQAFIGKLQLEGFALNADMVYITQSAGRIVRAIFEICMKNGWAQAAEVALNVCKMVDKRMWSCMTVLRQFKGVPEEILRRIERKEQFTFEHFYSMTAQQIGELIKLPKLGKILHKLIHQFPKLEVKPYLQPITRLCLRIDISISLDFQWEAKVHGNSEPFWLLVVDCNGEEILYSEYFVLKQKEITQKDQVFSITVPLFENLHPLYYIKVISDRWLQSETIMPVSFKNLILPERFSAPTELYDLQLLPASSLDKEGQTILKKLRINKFNQIQTQVFQSFYKNTSDNIFLGAPTGSGKSLCMYLSMLATMQSEEYANKKIIYVSPKEELLNIFYEEMEKLFTGNPFNKKIGILQGQLQSDLKIMEKHDIILCSAENLDIVTRRWKARKVLLQVKLMIFDELHMLNENYAVMEVVISRMRLIQSKLAEQTKLQLIGLSASLADYKEMSAWLGANSSNTYNFHPNVRPFPVETIVYPFDQNDRKARIMAMQKYMYQGIKNMAKDRSTMVFVNDRKQARLTALELTTLQASDNNPKKFLRGQEKALKQLLKEVNIKDPIILSILEAGIGLLYEGQDELEKKFVRLLYKKEIIQVLIVTYKLSWELTEHAFFTVILDNQRYDGYEKRYIDYTIPDMFQMIGRTQNKQSEVSAKTLVLCHSPKKDYYKKFLMEPYPVESHLNHYLNNHLCGEIVAKNITSTGDCIDWITWTFMYWRLSQNPNYYNLLEVSGTAITDYLSELIETTLDELKDMKCIDVVEELELQPLNLGIISSFYYIHTSSIEMFADNISDESKMKQLIQIVANATEFEEIPIRIGEDNILRQLSYSIKYKFDKDNFEDPSVKTSILLQNHFSRRELSADLRYDQQQVLERASRLVHAMVDVISSNFWLDQVIKTMQLNQMIVQAQWADESTLYQLPYIDRNIVSKLNKKDVKDIEDFLNMEDDDRSEILKDLDDDQIQEMAEAANRYPTVSMQYVIANDKEDIHAGDEIQIQVQIEREGDEEDYTDYVIAPYYPKQKEELWWVIIGDKESNKLYSIKRISFKAQTKANLKFEINEQGKHDLKIFLICDSYIGCEQAESFTLNILESQDSDEDEEDE